RIAPCNLHRNHPPTPSRLAQPIGRRSPVYRKLNQGGWGPKRFRWEGCRYALPKHSSERGGAERAFWEGLPAALPSLTLIPRKPPHPPHTPPKPSPPTPPPKPKSAQPFPQTPSPPPAARASPKSRARVSPRSRRISRSPSPASPSPI